MTRRVLDAVAGMRSSTTDLPIAGGLVPLLFQNGTWVEDAFFGGAFTIPSRNSKTLDISNFDTTFFIGLDRVTSAIDNNADGEDSRICGVTTFIDTTSGCWEAGYGFTEDRTNSGLDYHNLMVSFSRRYRDWFSNSLRASPMWDRTPMAAHRKRPTARCFCSRVP